MSPRMAALYPLAVLAAASACVLLWPVFAGDTDLWYHLSAGRFIFEHGELPGDSFFSFLSPPRPWRDYSWLSQVLFYAAHRAAGYPGLILLRGAAFAALLAVVWRFLAGSRAGRSSVYAGLLLSLYALMLLPRCLLVRPHLFTYLLLAVFLLALERRPRWAPVLPALAAAWGNLHGISYPVVLLVLGAYVAEHFLSRPSGARAEDGQRDLALRALAMAAVFLTPLGAGLVSIPFIPLDYASRIVGELRPLSWPDLATVSLARGSLSPDSAFNILLALALLSLLAAAAERRARPAHLILLAGGLLLLEKGNRCRYECALLALPLLGSGPPWKAGASPLPRALAAPVLAVLMALPLFSLWSFSRNRPRYPFSRYELPSGAAAFLRRVDTGGRVLHPPDPAGYLEWTLYPRYRLTMDMQFPHLFGDSDLYLFSFAFSREELLAQAVSTYRPDYILAPLSAARFPDLIARHPEYVPVFFDDFFALYADRTAQPSVAREYALPVDPFDVPEISSGTRALPGYLARMLEIDPDCLKTRWRAAKACLNAGDTGCALAHAEAVVAAYPNLAFGYLLRGTALRDRGELEPALEAFRTALAKAPDELKAQIHGDVSEAHRQGGRMQEALDAKREGYIDVPPDAWILEEARRLARQGRESGGP